MSSKERVGLNSAVTLRCVCRHRVVRNHESSEADVVDNQAMSDKLMLKTNKMEVISLFGGEVEGAGKWGMACQMLRCSVCLGQSQYSGIL